MRIALALFAAAALAACFKKPAPPVPPELAAALDDFGRACNGEAGAPALPYVSEKLIDQMSMYSGRGVPVRMQADLQTMKREVAVIAAQFNNGDPQAQARWRDLRPKIDRVLQGENPEPGPRYQLEAPEAARVGIEEADAALAGGDMKAFGSALGRARVGICEWAEKMPGPRGARMMDVCQNDLDGLSMNVSAYSPAQARAEWERIKARLQPGAEF
jgi:hypothetical protein